MNMHSEIYKRIRDNIIRTWPAWKRKIYNSCLAVSIHAEKLPEDDRTRSTPVWTKYDRLISKTPEELAELLSHVCCPYFLGENVDCNVESKGCYACWISWLKSPVGVEE